MKTRDLVIVSLAAALSTALGMIRLIELPQGGSITLELLPILYVAFWLGPVHGVSAGVLSGLIQLLLRPFVVHPVQVLLDYPLPMAAAGLAGYLRHVDSERLLRTGILLTLGLVFVFGVGLNWVELHRIGGTSTAVLLAESDGWETHASFRPDTVMGDVEARIVTSTAGEDGEQDTARIVTAHGSTARTWMAEASQVLVGKYMRWFGGFVVFVVLLLGVAALAWRISVGAVSLGVLAGCSLAFVCHFISGVVFFAAYAPPGHSVWAYSAAYNASYIIPQTVLSLVLLPPLLKRVRI